MLATPDRIRWSRVAVEGLVIVGSILLALGLEAWLSGAQARRAAHRELGTILAELQEGRDELEDQRRRHLRSLSGTQAILERIETAPPDVAVSVPDTLVTQLITIFVSDVPTAVLDAFVSSGQLQELRIEGLKRSLLRWPSAVQDLRDDESRARTHLDQEVVPYLRRFDVTRAIELPSRRRSPGEAELRSTIELNNLLKLQQIHMEVLLIGAERALRSLEELTNLIDQELL